MASGFQFIKIQDGFALTYAGRTVLSHTGARPALFIGFGVPHVKMFRGNFELRDRIDARLPLRTVKAEANGVTLSHPDAAGEITLTAAVDNGILRLRIQAEDARCNRFWIRFPAKKGEHVTGGGEQFSFLDLRGRLFPIWTREQGVGRNKLTEITRLSDALDGSGGDYHTTFYPQPTFVSSEKYFVHLENYEYSELDFREEDFHEVCVWSRAVSFAIGINDSYAGLTEQITALLGRQPALPDWAMQGLWLGVQGGTERAVTLRDRCADAGINVSAVWVQDWEGTRMTSFGKRNFWDWRWSEKLYPGLDKVIAEDKNRAWMGYINPYIVEDGVLFQTAKKKVIL